MVLYINKKTFFKKTYFTKASVWHESKNAYLSRFRANLKQNLATLCCL